MSTEPEEFHGFEDFVIDEEEPEVILRTVPAPRPLPDYATIWADAGGPPGMHDQPLQVRWHVHPNDVIGGWAVMPVDHPPSCGVPEIADFCHKEAAEHIALLHNAAIDATNVADATADRIAATLHQHGPQVAGLVLDGIRAGMREAAPLIGAQIATDLAATMKPRIVEAIEDGVRETLTQMGVQQ